MAIRILQLHKKSSYEFKNIQDKYSLNKDLSVISLADGTTQSFKSELWAELITKTYSKKPTLDANQLISLFKKEADIFKTIDFEFSNIPAKASLERDKLKSGGTATFVGAIFNDNNELSLINIGDSNLFILKGSEFISFPYSTVDELDQNRFFINSENLLSNKIDSTSFVRKNFKLNNDDKVIIATDALSRLLLKHPEYINNLVKIEDFDSFLSFCTKYWDNKEMEDDDVTAILIHNLNLKDIEIIIPPFDFSFPREVEIEFIPIAKIDEKIDLNNKEMEIFKNNIAHISNELIYLKKKNKLQEMLLMLALSFLIINILLVIYYRPKNDNMYLEKVQKEYKEIIIKKDLLIQEQKEEIENLKQEIKGSIRNTSIPKEDSMYSIKKEESLNVNTTKEVIKNKTDTGTKTQKKVKLESRN